MSDRERGDSEDRFLTVAPARVIVTTDPELDDLNSMLRLLLYSNEIDIAALVYSASRFHHRGDPDRGIAAHRWPAAGDRMHIDEAVDAYEAAYDNLVRHDPRYPLPADLRAIIAEGNVDEAGDTRHPTAGSDLVKAVLLGEAPGQVFAQAWGGTNTIARALMSIEDEFRGTDRWEEIYALIVGRTVITSFAEQDDTFADYIRPTWPELEFRDVATAAWGYFAWDVVPDDAREYLTAEWTRENVSTIGPLGRAYRVWGDGKQMAEGPDPEDYFGVPDAAPESLAAQGYMLWAPLRPSGAWISEGDTSNFAMHIDNGLRNAEHPTFGGWGGRLDRDEKDASPVEQRRPSPVGTRRGRGRCRRGRPVDRCVSARLRRATAVERDVRVRRRQPRTSDPRRAAGCHRRGGPSGRAPVLGRRPGRRPRRGDRLARAGSRVRGRRIAARTDRHHSGRCRRTSRTFTSSSRRSTVAHQRSPGYARFVLTVATEDQ